MNAITLAFVRAGYFKHTVSKNQSGWSANLSYKTYQALKNQGVME
jgi:hypothetical protein